MSKQSEKRPTGSLVTGLVGLAVLGAVTYLERPTQYPFPVTRVIDGDTVEIEAPFLPVELKQKLSVRLFGIDTPEKEPNAKCALENMKSLRAKLFVEQELSHAKEVRVVLKSWDKYGGRVLGDVLLDGRSLSQMMIDKGHAISYNGEKKTMDWCKK